VKIASSGISEKPVGKMTTVFVYVAKQGKFIGSGGIDTVAAGAIMSSLILQADGSTKQNSRLESGSG
jgi:hypothetical protein